MMLPKEPTSCWETRGIQVKDGGKILQQLTREVDKRQLGDKRTGKQVHTQTPRPRDTSKITRPGHASVSKELEPHKGKRVSGKNHG